MKLVAPCLQSIDGFPCYTSHSTHSEWSVSKQQRKSPKIFMYQPWSQTIKEMFGGLEQRGHITSSGCKALSASEVSLFMNSLIIHPAPSVFVVTGMFSVIVLCTVHSQWLCWLLINKLFQFLILQFSCSTWIFCWCSAHVLPLLLLQHGIRWSTLLLRASLVLSLIDYCRC